MEKMKKYTIYRTTESSIELEGKSLKDIESQIEEIDGDDDAWVYNDETFDVVAGKGMCVKSISNEKEFSILDACCGSE